MRRRLSPRSTKVGAKRRRVRQREIRRRFPQGFPQWVEDFLGMNIAVLL
jgi:hypothetical protein